MKRNQPFRFYVAVCVFFATSLLRTQQAPPPAANNTTVTEEQVNDANVQLMRQDIRSQRKKIVAANLPLTEEEAAKFWPVYDQYIAETIKVNDTRYALIKEYARSYNSNNMSEEQGDSFIKRWLALDQQNTDLRLRFIPEFEKVLSAKKTAMFFQIDRRVGMMIELQLSGQVPLVKP